MEIIKTTTLPTHTADALVVPAALVAALMQFACKDPTRFHLSGLGLDSSHLCATDGHTAARVMGCDPGGCVPKERDGSFWEGEYVELQIRMARAAKATKVALRWDAQRAGAKYPPISAVMHEGDRSVRASGPVALDPTYLARLAALATAVQGKRKNAGDQSVALVHTPPEDAASEPFIWEVRGKSGAPTIEVAIMPVRI